MKTIHAFALTAMAIALSTGVAYAQQRAGTGSEGAQPTPPARPAVQPVRPVAQPARPLGQSARPLAQPTRPLTQPVRPLAEPTRPLVQPQVPTTRIPGQPPGTATREFGGDRTPGYEEINARGDGSVRRVDLSRHADLQERFGEIDTVPDGTITRAEYEAWKARDRTGEMVRPPDGDD